MNFKDHHALYIIAGPSASGKSSYALDMAVRYGGEILNADSMQVYRDLKVLSAQPTNADQQIVPHHGYDFLDAESTFSAGAWRRWIDDHIKRLQTLGKPVFIVGGTGLYIRTLTHPFIELPAMDLDIRERLNETMRVQGLSYLYRQLQACDPVTHARLAANDPQRIIRALEVYQGTGKPISHWQAKQSQRSTHTFHKIVILPERQTLYQRADERVISLFQRGSIDEVAQLIERQVPLSAPIFRTIGSQPLHHYLMGKMPLDQALALTQQHTRNYIKRQFTWFRNQFTADVVME